MRAQAVYRSGWVMPPFKGGNATVPCSKTASAASTASTKTSASSRTTTTTRTAHRQKTKSKSRTPRLSRRLLLALFLLFLVFDTAVLSLWRLQGSYAIVPPHTDPATLISQQLDADAKGNISVVGYDTDLTFSRFSTVSLVDTASLEPIENNLYREATQADEPALLFDEMIVRRIISLNADWVDYLNHDNPAVFSSVAPQSRAETALAQLDTGSQVVYYRLAFGEICHIEDSYYIIVQANYALNASSQTAGQTTGQATGPTGPTGRSNQSIIHDEIFIYKLTAVDGTMLITDFEQISAQA